MTRKADPRTARLPVREIVAQGGELPAFTPVPRQGSRHDGWTPERQRGFIEALADTGSVEAACKAVDMSQSGAYQLRRQPGAESFRAAWATALDLGVQIVEDVAMDRALNGVPVPIFYQGEQCGERRRYNDRLLMFILRNRAPERFPEGRHGGGMGRLNAVGRTELERQKKKWRAEWEAEQARVTPEDLRASIDRKIEGLRRRLEPARLARWARMSQETRAAWERFVTLRDRDLAAMEADEETRALIEVRWDARGDTFEQTYPPPKLVKGREVRGEPEDMPTPGPDFRKVGPPAEAEPKTRWTLRDEGFDP